MTQKLRIAHLSGPTATIQNLPALITSNKARAARDLPLRKGPDGNPSKYDALRAQRLAAPAKVYVEQFSAHPLEADAAELYGPPDGYVGTDGTFKRERRAESDKPVYELELRPEDGLYPLPYMALQADGRPWEEEQADAGGPAARARQGFYPDGSRPFDEIDRLGVMPDGSAGGLSALADITFHRVLPPSGFTKGVREADRTDEGTGDIPAEVRGRDFFPYKPRHISATPPRPALARATNRVQAILSSGEYDGAIWTQGSPNIEDSTYWFNLLIDTPLPIACNSAQRPQGLVSNDGPQNIIDSVRYIGSRVWADPNGRNRLGVLLIQDHQFFAAREAAKGDARPGGYIATGGHGGILGQINLGGRAIVMYIPAYKHTHMSDVRITQLPSSVEAVRLKSGKIERFEIDIKDSNGELLEDAIPSVSILKDGGYCTSDWGDDPDLEEDLKAAIAHKLKMGRLTGFVVEGTIPAGNMTSPARLRLVSQAVFSGIPVVRTGRGSPNGFAIETAEFIGGSNLTSTKARFLLMASLMKFGSFPVAVDPKNPTDEERRATGEATKRYQAVFDTH
jgi:L-asparaginase